MCPTALLRTGAPRERPLINTDESLIRARPAAPRVQDARQRSAAAARSDDAGWCVRARAFMNRCGDGAHLDSGKMWLRF